MSPAAQTTVLINMKTDRRQTGNMCMIILRRDKMLGSRHESGEPFFFLNSPHSTRSPTCSLIFYERDLILQDLTFFPVANEQAQTARLKLVKVLARHGAIDYMAPDFSTKESAQALAGVDMAKLVAEKETFKATLLQEWNK
jgi:hypothetical protein